MRSQLQIVSILVSLGLFLLVFELVRRRRLLERYALLWLFTAIVLLGLSVWSQLLDQVSRAIGVGYGPSTLFAVALGFIAMLLLHFSVVISRLAEQNKVLAQHVGLLQRRLEHLEAGRDPQDAPPLPPPPVATGAPGQPSAADADDR
ncbi:DUF2304 domain-containing protein [Patulibacter sp. SYSU D01012]|uniref:DUF2304 domain-containing protein n=1 Tax=Patulibacter sp. SYSU D01012 TaxID=2817381 RepID=UPI001B302087